MLLITLEQYVVFVGVFQAVHSQAMHLENSHHMEKKMQPPNVINEPVTLNDLVIEFKKQVQDLTSHALQQDSAINHLSEKNEERNFKIQWLENENSRHEHDILKLKNENSKHKEDIVKIEKENSKQNEELLHLKAQLKSQELYIHEELNSYQTESFQQIQAINTTLSKHTEKMNSFVTFTAYATEDRDYTIQDVVLFDGIVVNSEFYDSTTSIFTCPYSGFYLFSVSVRVIGDSMSVEIMLDGLLLVSTAAQDTGYDHGSTVVVTWCDEGQEVWIRCRGSDNRMNGDAGRYSTFSGTLLRVI